MIGKRIVYMLNRFTLICTDILQKVCALSEALSIRTAFHSLSAVPSMYLNIMCNPFGKKE